MQEVCDEQEIQSHTLASSPGLVLTERRSWVSENGDIFLDSFSAAVQIVCLEIAFALTPINWHILHW